MLQFLIQHVPEIVIVIDPSGTVRFSNPQLEKVLGLRTADVVGRNIFDFIHPDDVHRAAMEYSETIRKPGEWRGVGIEGPRREWSLDSLRDHRQQSTRRSGNSGDCVHGT